MNRTGWPVLTFVSVVLGVVFQAVPASASCAQDSGPQGSPLVFVGQVEENRRGYTELRVDEVWRGPSLAPMVWVRSGQEQPPWPLNLIATVSGGTDADLLVGNRYVIGASKQFDANACTVAEASSVSESTGLNPPTGFFEPVATGSAGADPPASNTQISLRYGAGLTVLLLLTGGYRRWLRARE